MKKYKISVVGATGRIGSDILANFFKEESLGFETEAIKSTKRLWVGDVTVLGSKKSKGQRVSFGEKVLEVGDVDDHTFNENEIVFLATDEKISKTLAPKAAEAGAIVIDSSPYFRMHEDVLLVVPEINGHLLGSYKKGQIIANPNCCAIPLAITMDAFLRAGFTIKRVVVSTYQSVSGAGRDAMNELLHSTKVKFGPQFDKKSEKSEIIFKKGIAFNCIPFIGHFLDNNFTTEEEKLMHEPLKILGSRAQNIKISATCVRVPVFVGHCQVVNIEFTAGSKSATYGNLMEAFEDHESIEVFDRPNNDYITPTEVVKSDFVHVSRLRIDNTVSNGAVFWVASDNLHKGGAFNAVSIAEELASLII